MILFLRGVRAILFEENCIFCYALLCISNTYKTNIDVSNFFYRGLLNLTLSTLIQRKRAIRSKGDLWTFDGFQAKPLWKLEVLQRLLALSFLHRSYKNTQLLFFVTVFFKIFMRKTLTDHFGGLHKNRNCGFPFKILLKGMLRQNIQHFLKKPTQERLGISKMKQLEKIFLLFQTVCIFYFCKIMNSPVVTSCFWLIDLWRNNDHMFWENY